MRAADIIAAVAATFAVTAEDITSKNRSRRTTRPRFAACWLLHTFPSAGGIRRSYPECGRFVGGRDHSTIINAVRQAEYLLTTDAEFREALVSAGEIAGGCKPLAAYVAPKPAPLPVQTPPAPRARPAPPPAPAPPYDPYDGFTAPVWSPDEVAPSDGTVRLHARLRIGSHALLKALVREHPWCAA